jgi:DNA polymerase III delta prime subunit
VQNIFSSDLTINQALVTSFLSAAWHKNRLLPAYLLTGRATPVKWRLAKQLAAHLNCPRLADSSWQSCLVGREGKTASWCVNCRWIEEDKHPQAIRVLNGEGTKTGKIAIEKARELTEELAKASNYYRIVIVEDASEEIFHRPAANTLLKTIEEPHPGILLIFFALTKEEVLPTIVSRCQTLEVIGSTLKEEGVWSLSQRFEESDVLKTSKFEEISRLANEARVAHRKDRKKGLVISVHLAEAMQALLEDEELDFDQLIDATVAKELCELREKIPSSAHFTNYAQQLLNLCEMAKTHNRQFVSRKPLIETLVFSWEQLRLKLKC